MLIFLLTVVALLCIVHFYMKYNACTRALRKVPCPKEDFLIGNALELATTPVEVFKLGRRYAKTFNGIYGWYSLFLRAINVYNPEDIETVISSSKNSEKSMIYQILKPWLQEGLLVSKGPKWVHRRKILTPTFHFNILKRFVSIMEENSRQLVVDLLKTKGEAVDVIPVISGYTLTGICETAMGTRLDEESSNEGIVYKSSLQKLSNVCVVRMSRIHYFWDTIFNMTALSKHFYKHLKIITKFTKRIIKERKEFVEENGINFADTIEDNDDVYLNGKKKKIAMLDLMISAEKEGGIDGPGIQEEVDTFMFEGHDTTAAGLEFCMMLLANHKDIQHKIVKELDEIFGESDRSATIDDLNAMKYLECCIKESMRLYPPVPFIGRKLSDNVVLSGYEIPAGIQCHIHIYDLHRKPDLYPNPDKFDPNRFLPENSVGRHPYAYIPFSAGPRNCIGQRFAMLEMKSCISNVLRKFELQPVTEPSDVEFTADLVLRSTKPVYVKFVEKMRSY